MVSFKKHQRSAAASLFEKYRLNFFNMGSDLGTRKRSVPQGIDPRVGV